MTQVNASMTFDTRRMEESITSAVEAKLAETVASIVLPGIAQVAADVQRLTKLLEAEAVEPAEFAAVLAHSGAISIEVATAQAASLARLGYRLVAGEPSSAPAPVAATWDGPTPPQAAPAVRVTTGEVPVVAGPLWTPPPATEIPGPSKVFMTEPDKDKAWTASFE